MGRFLSFLGSARLALTLVSLLVGFFIAVAVRGKEALVNPWFVGVLSTFTLNIAVCTARRATRLLREDGQKDPRPEPTGSNPGEHKPLAAAAAVLAAQGYKVISRPNEVLAEKHRFARWGPVLLHFGFLVVLAGAVTSVALRTEGHFRVVEGQIFASPAGQYLIFKRGVWAANPPRFTVYLHKVKVSKYTEGAVVAGELLFLEEGRPLRQATVETGRPATYRGLSFHEEIFGYAVGVILRERGSGRIYPLRVGLETALYPGGEKYAGQLQVPGSPYRMKVEFFPTLGGTTTAPRTASYEPRDPAVFLKIEGCQNQKSTTIYEGVLRLGQNAKTQGYEVRFDHYRQWLGMTVIRDPGRPVIYAGCALVLLGLFLTYLVFPRRVRISAAANGTFTVKGWAPRFSPLIAEEVKRLRQEIKRQTELEGYDAGD